jgi:uncharacterized membrane protein
MDEEKLKSLKTLTMVVYALQAAGFFIGLTWIVALIVNYVKREEAAGTFLESHFRWQIRTFWWGLAGAIAGLILMLVLIGWLLWIAVAVWAIYRIVKGGLYLNDGKPMPDALV